MFNELKCTVTNNLKKKLLPYINKRLRDATS